MFKEPNSKKDNVLGKIYSNVSVQFNIIHSVLKMQTFSSVKKSNQKKRKSENAGAHKYQSYHIPYGTLWQIK